MKREIALIILVFCLISTISALDCSQASIIRSIEKGETPTSQSITCTNNNNYNVSIFKSGDFFDIDPSTITIQNNSQLTFDLNFNQLDIEGDYSGFLYSSDGTTISVSVEVLETSAEAGIIVFPTAKVINIQQGQTKNQNIQLIVPSNYPESVTVNSVSFNPDADVIRFGDLDMGVLSPGQTLNIPLIVDATNVQTGTYSTQIDILATNSSGQIQLPSVNLQIVVSVGVNPITNSTFSTPPSCSLSSLEYNLNSTYTLTCTNTIDNIQINVGYNEYLEGTKVEYGGGTYKYYFRAKKLGSSTFIATFSYMGSSIFEAFKKEFKVTPSGSSVIGDVNLKLQFFQSGVEKTLSNLHSGETIIVPLDNKTNNIVQPFKVILDGEEQNSSKITLESNKEYNLRITSNGYNDLAIENLSVTQMPISITLNPEKSFYTVGETVNITTNIENSSILVNNYVVSSLYTFTTSGNNTIRAEKEGYETGEIVVIVEPKTILQTSSCTLETEKWKKGKEVVCGLSEEADWTVYLDGVQISNGSGKEVSFKIEDNGLLEIKSDGTGIWSQTIEGSGIWKWIKEHWLISGGIVLGMFIIIYLWKINKDENIGTPIDKE